MVPISEVGRVGNTCVHRDWGSVEGDRLWDSSMEHERDDTWFYG